MLFMMTLIVLGFVGGLFIVSRYREDDPRLTIGFLLLLSFLGTIVFFAGVYYHVTGTLLYSWKGGLVTGGQLMISDWRWQYFQHSMLSERFERRIVSPNKRFLCIKEHESTLNKSVLLRINYNANLLANHIFTVMFLFSISKKLFSI
jgi:hypothetical protein